MKGTTNERKDISSINALYNRAFYNFDKYLNDIYIKSSQNTENEGYLIDLKDLEEIKKKTDYNKNKVKSDKIYNQKLNKKLYTLKKINCRSSQNLINMIENNNQYILINKELWELLCEKGEEDTIPIKYEIKSDIINFKLIDNKILKFYQNKEIKNLIDKDTYENKNSNKSDNEELKIIYEDINKYYKFEKEFLENIKKKESTTLNTNYSVTKNWFDNWKEYTYYEEIKKNFFEKQKVKENEIINELKKYKEKKKSKLIPVEIKQFKGKEELESILKKDSLVLVNSISPLKQYANIYIKYYIYDNKITFDTKDKVCVKSNNNIISLNGLINDTIINNAKSTNNNDLKQLKIDIFTFLIILFSFEKELQDNLNESKNDFTLKKNDFHIKNCYLINKDIISEFKNILEYNKIKGLIEKNKNVLTSKIDTKFLEKNKEIENYINSISNQKIQDLINKLKNINLLKIDKKNDANSQKYFYPINFDIINKDIYLQLLLILNKKKEEIEKKIEISFHKGKLLLNPEKSSFFNDNNSFYIYKYLLNKINEISLVYIPKSIKTFLMKVIKLNILK